MVDHDEPAVMPSEASTSLTWFDRFASAAETVVSHAWFFVLCVATVLLWFPTLFLMEIDSSQLIINTSTTIVTFLLVSLMQNTAKRGADAQQQKLNALATAFADYLDLYDDCGEAAAELREAVGLEHREST